LPGYNNGEVARIPVFVTLIGYFAIITIGGLPGIGINNADENIPLVNLPSVLIWVGCGADGFINCGYYAHFLLVGMWDLKNIKIHRR
jgi:hypothetical protein